MKVWSPQQLRTFIERTNMRVAALRDTGMRCGEVLLRHHEPWDHECIAPPSSHTEMI
jgi:hypothetical protein